MNERNILVSFVGDLEHDITSSLLQNIRKSINKTEPVKKVRTYLYDVIVECLDNMIRHNVKKPMSRFAGKIPSTLFVFSRQEGHYKIVTGNHIHNDSTQKLKEHLDQLNSLDKKSLRKFHDQLIARKFTTHLQHGIGLVELAMKASGKLQYEFRPVEKDISFYIFQVSV
jgi:hypothetical protein